MDRRRPDPVRRPGRRARPRDRRGAARPGAQPDGRRDRRGARERARAPGARAHGDAAGRALRRGRRRRRPGDAALRARRLHRRPAAGRRARGRTSRRSRTSCSCPTTIRSSEVDLAAIDGFEVARASSVTDADGTRRATLLFSEGTDAEMVLPDGSTEPLDELHVRATEYTIGDAGPDAMPAVLPPSSGYTYAVELSADEAVDAGADRGALRQARHHLRRRLPRVPGRERRPERLLRPRRRHVGRGAERPRDRDRRRRASTRTATATRTRRASWPRSGSPPPSVEQLAGLYDPGQAAVARRGRALHAVGLQLALRPAAGRHPAARPAADARRRPAAEEGVLWRRLDHRLPQPASRRDAADRRDGLRAGLLERPGLRAAREAGAPDPAHARERPGEPARRQARDPRRGPELHTPVRRRARTRASRSRGTGSTSTGGRRSARSRSRSASATTTASSSTTSRRTWPRRSVRSEAPSSRARAGGWTSILWRTTRAEAEASVGGFDARGVGLGRLDARRAPSLRPSRAHGAHGGRAARERGAGHHRLRRHGAGAPVPAVRATEARPRQRGSATPTTSS